jgi:GntR family transcriptional regulator
MQWLASPPPDHFLLIDPDPELRQILLTELRAATSWPVAESSPTECCNRKTLTAAVPLCRPSQAKVVRAALPKGIELVPLPTRSANAWLSPWLPAPRGHLVAVVSHWPEFLERARAMLIAAGLSPDTLLFRDARKPRWRRGLEEVTAILCDSYTAALPTLPQKPFHIVYTLLADTAADELRQFTLEPKPKKTRRA